MVTRVQFVPRYIAVTKLPHSASLYAGYGLFVQPLHYTSPMPTIHRLPNMTIRVNVPDHLPPHVHVVMGDRRDASVDLATLAVISHTLRESDIADALVWIDAHRALAARVFKECNP